MCPKPPPKRRNALETKARILAAAQKVFSEVGYSQAGVRDIASIADVSSTMPMLYYGSKAGLYEAALIGAMRTAELLPADKSTFGEMLAELFLNVEIDVSVPSMIMLSTSDPDALQITQRVTKEYAITTLEKWLGPPDANVRAVEIFMLSSSFLFFARNLPLLGGGKNSEKKFAKWFAKTIQDIVDQSKN